MHWCYQSSTSLIPMHQAFGLVASSLTGAKRVIVGVPVFQTARACFSAEGRLCLESMGVMLHWWSLIGGIASSYSGSSLSSSLIWNFQSRGRHSCLHVKGCLLCVVDRRHSSHRKDEGFWAMIMDLKQGNCHVISLFLVLFVSSAELQIYDATTGRETINVVFSDRIGMQGYQRNIMFR